jgi:voltage-gated potassium channel
LILIVIFVGSISIFYFERGVNETIRSIFDALWMVIVTVTTVGYGDKFPVTPYGKMIGVLVMFVGIGFLGMFTATIASIFVERRIKEGRGLKIRNFRDHIIICGWSKKAKEVILELLGEKKPIVILANLDEKPIEDKLVYFVKGNPTKEEDLIRANIKEAKSVIILADDTVPSPDATSVLTVLAIETLNPNVYTCVELLDSNNIRHVKRARADEVVVSGEMSSKLLASAARNPGITQIFSELITSKYGNFVYKVPLPKKYIGRSFDDTFFELKRDHKVILLAFERENKFIANPIDEYIFKEGDQLIFIGRSKPTF